MAEQGMPDGKASDRVIRRGVVADAAALAEFAARTFEQTFAGDNRPEDMAAHRAAAYGVAQQSAELADPDVVTLVALDRERLVGYAQIRRGAAPDCVTHAAPVELQRFYLDRGEHGSGLAMGLMSAVHAAVREFGGRHLWLGVWERNARALAFYAKSGFVDVGSKVYVVGQDPQIDRVMVAPVRD